MPSPSGQRASARSRPSGGRRLRPIAGRPSELAAAARRSSSSHASSPWTNYGTGKVDSNKVRDIIGGSLVINKTLEFGEYIGQHNSGNHTTLYDSNCQASVNTSLSSQDIPVPVVDHNGNFQGWATFHVDHAVGGSEKHVYGCFVSPFVNLRLTVGNCAAGTCPRYLGSPSITLVN